VTWLAKINCQLGEQGSGWNGYVVQVSGPWEATRSDRTLIPLSLNMDLIFQVAEPISEEVKAQVLKLYEILCDKRN